MRAGVRAYVCVCMCVCARARVWLGVRLFGELTGEPGPSRGRADSAGCRGQPVLQPRPLNQPAPPDLCSAPGRRQPFPLGRARPGQVGEWGVGRRKLGQRGKAAGGDVQVPRYAPRPRGKPSSHPL